MHSGRNPATRVRSRNSGRLLAGPGAAERANLRGAGDRPALPSTKSPGRVPIQAAINAVHVDADTFEQTWHQILARYDHLLVIAPTPVVALNRAIAIGELHGPAAALTFINELEFDNYYAFHAARADLLRRLGRNNEAAVPYERTAALAPTDAERSFLRLGGRSWRPASLMLAQAGVYIGLRLISTSS